MIIKDALKISGVFTYERLKKAKWYQRLWAKVSSNYKMKFIDQFQYEVDENQGAYTITLASNPKPGTVVTVKALKDDVITIQAPFKDVKL